MDKEKCEHCIYYYEPDINITQKVCNFPWFAWNEKDTLNMLCKEKED